MASPPTGTSAIWLGRAKARAQITTIQVTAYDAATTYSIICNGKAVTAIAAGSANATATALAAAWEAATEPEFTEVTASANTDTVTLTCDTAGLPFTVTSSVSGGTGTIGAPSTTTTATGPNHVSNVNNWSGGVLPQAGDDVYVPGGTASLLYDLDALTAIDPNSLTILANFGDLGETIGLPFRNLSGYYEYRDRYWEFAGCTLCRIGRGDGRGSTRIFIDFGSAQTAVEGILTAQSPDGITPACIVKGTHASNTIEVLSGSYGVAFDAGSVSTFTTARNANATIRFGTGTTLATLTTSGTTHVDCATTTTNVKAGNCSVNGSGAHGTVNCIGGQLNYNTSGTCTTMNIGGGTTSARVDCSADISTRTWTTTTLSVNGSIFDPAQTVTYTNAIARGSSVSEIICN